LTPDSYASWTLLLWLWAPDTCHGGMGSPSGLRLQHLNPCMELSQTVCLAPCLCYVYVCMYVCVCMLAIPLWVSVMNLWEIFGKSLGSYCTGTIEIGKVLMDTHQLPNHQLPNHKPRRFHLSIAWMEYRCFQQTPSLLSMGAMSGILVWRFYTVVRC